MTMTNPHGSHIWYELLTSDADAATAFYSDVVGWSIGTFCPDGGDAAAPAGEGVPPPMDYRILTAPDGGGVGGLMNLPDGAEASGMRPGWFGYVGVDDVDASVESIVAAGGKVYMPAFDLAGVGRIAMVADGQGAAFYVMRGASDGTSTAFDHAAFGHIAWNELTTTDVPAALDFYTGRFGWTKGDVMPMGPMGDYQFINQGDDMIGAMMPSQPESGPPAWRYYFHVPDIDAAAASLGAGGGTILHGPAEIPGGEYSIIAVDPQGASFGLVGPRKS